MINPKVVFFPYIRSNLSNKYDSLIKNSDILIDYFPSLNQKWSKEIQLSGVKWLGYISIYKAPIISEVGYNSGFNGGAQCREEIEINPYWSSINLDLGHRHAAVDQNHAARFPFDKKEYKKGWYQLCIIQEGVNRAIFDGVSKLLETGLDGIFIDNIISHSQCHEDECIVQDYNNSQVSCLNNLVKHMKDNGSFVMLNVGRDMLFNPKVMADIYVTENFCYGQKTDINRLFFAGKYLSKDELSEDLRSVVPKVTEQGGKLLGYTKTPNRIRDSDRRRMLEIANQNAKNNKILWTSTLSDMFLTQQ